MTLEQIVESIEIQKTLNELYAEKSKKSPWLMELFQQAYMKLADKIRLTSKTHSYVTYEHACYTLDNLGFTLIAIYEQRIRHLEKQLRENGISET